MSRSRTTLALALASVAGAGCGGATHHASSTQEKLAALHQQVLAAQAAPSKEKYGTLPAYLAARQGDPNAVLTATPDGPARTTQGAAIQLRLGSGRATATAVGPSIPLRLQGTDVSSAPAHFRVTFTGVHGQVPLHTNLFGVVDEHGGIHVPDVDVQRHGDTARVDVHLRLPSGEGQIVYSPTGTPLATWDFTLETY